MDPTSLVAAVAANLATALIGAIATRGHKIALGSDQDRALRAAVRDSVETAFRQYPQLWDISADITVLADQTIAEELLDHAIHGDGRPFAAAIERWQSEYGTEPDQLLTDALSASADMLAKAMQSHESLQALWTALTTGVIREGVDEIRSAIGFLTDPKRIVRVMQEEIGQDPRLAVEIASELAKAVGRGPFGALGEVAIGGTPGAPTLQFHPRAGSETTIRVTKQVPDTPEGREEMAAFLTAVERGAPFDTKADVAVEVDGRRIPLPSDVRVVSAAVETTHPALVTLRSRVGVDQLYTAMKTNHEVDRLIIETTPDSPGLIEARLEVQHEPRAISGTLSVRTDRIVTLMDQVTATRLAAHLRVGGTAEFWFPDRGDARLRQTFPPHEEMAWACRDLPALALLQDAERLLGVTGPAARLTPDDLSRVRFVRRLLRNGRATLPLGEGDFDFTLDNDVTNALRQAGTTGRINLRIDQPDWNLDITDRSFALGPVSVVLESVPALPDVTEVEGSFKVTLPIDHETRLIAYRPPLPLPSRD